MRPNWLDMLIYRLWYWRWNRILASRADLRELFIGFLKAYDVVDDGERITVTITRGATDHARVDE